MPVSVVPHRAHVVASPQRRPLRSRPRLACKPMAHRPYHCGTLRPTDRDVHRAAPPRSGRTPATHYSVACSSGREVHFPYRCGPLRPTDRDAHRAAAPRGSRTPAAGFAPPTRHARPLIFSPHATYRRLISSYKFLLSPSLFPVAAPIGPPLRAVGHRPAGTGAVCSSFLSAPRRRDSNGPFFHLQVLPVLAAPPAPLQASAPVALPRPPLGGRSPTTSAAQSPESRLCGGLSASIHPLHPPIARAPRL